MCVISIYFGIRIYNANENIHLTELNEFDKVYYDDITLVPTITFLAAVITLPFILAIMVLQIIAVYKSTERVVKNIAIGLTGVGLIILVVDMLTISNPEGFDFSQWGFVWICMGLFIIAGNLLSFAIYRFRREPNQQPLTKN